MTVLVVGRSRQCTGDNGASGEAGLNGTLNEAGLINGVTASLDQIEAEMDKLGGPAHDNNYS